MKLKIVLFILALLVSVQAAEAIEVSVSEMQFNPAPGSSEEKSLYVMNRGNESVIYKISIDDDYYSNWFEFFPSDSFELGAGENKEVKVKVKVPASTKTDAYCKIEILGVGGGNVNTGARIHVSINLSPSDPSENKPPGRSSKGSSGEGGGVDSLEPPGNVQFKEISQQFVISGKRIRFTFIQNSSCVAYLEFDAKKSFGKTTAIGEVLKNKSVLSQGLPDGEIYKFLNIWVGNEDMASQENIENAVVFFRVNKAWVRENNIDANSITLNHYADGKWNPLPTKKADDDGEYLFFKAETPGFSPFAITGDKIKENDTQDIAPPSEEALRDIGKETRAAENKSNEENTGILPGFDAFLAGTGLIILGLFMKKRILN